MAYQSKQKVKLVPAPWNVQAEALLDGAVGSNPSYTVAELRQEVEAGSSTLFGVLEGDRLLGYIATFIEDFGGGRELVLQSGAGISGKLEPLKKAVPAFAAYARSVGATSMRAHVEGWGRVRLFKAAGFKEAETVLRMVV